MSASTDPDWSDHCGDLWRRHVLASSGFDIEEVTGPSPRRPREWVALMRRLGARSMSGVVSAVHGPALALPLLAQRGDLVRAGWALGVCRGERAEFYGGRFVPMREVDEAWPLRLLAAGAFPDPMESEPRLHACTLILPVQVYSPHR